MVFSGYIMVVTWFSDDQPSYNTMVDIDTNMVHHVSTLFATAAQADNLDEEEVAIVMETAEVIERGRKDKLPGLRNVPTKKVLEETAKVDKVLTKFKTHSIT